jgi:flagellar hook-associated protein 1 FlgK
MLSTFFGIEMGKRGLNAHSQSLHTVGHNLSNMNTEGYSRQRVDLKPMDPLYVPGLAREETPGQIGQGTSIAQATRIRDEILEGRIVAQANGEGYWKARDAYILKLEKIHREITDVSLRSSMDQFWGAWQELSVHPAEAASRMEVLERGKTFIDTVHQEYLGLKRVRDELEQDVAVTTGEINTYAKNIAALNAEILKVKAQGDNPNDLMDQRDLFVEKLSGLINITVSQNDPDEFIVHTSGYHLVQGKEYRPLELSMDPLNDGYSKVIWSKKKDDLVLQGGKLAALLELRDKDLRGEIQKLDSLTVNFIDLVNEVHSSAYGLNQKTGNDFFVEYPAVNNAAGNYDRDGDGAYDSSYIFRISGQNTLNPQEQIGLAGEMVFSDSRGEVRIPYHPTDTVEDVIARINYSGAEISARLDREGRLTLKGAASEDPARPDFVIRHVEDSGLFLAGYTGLLAASGPEGAFSWDRPDAAEALAGGPGSYAVAPLAHPSAWIEVNRELEREPASIAAAFGQAGRPGESGDGSAALAIAALRNQPVMIGKITTFDNYFSEAVAAVGFKGEQAQISLEREELTMKDLRTMREEISGVNENEELANMIKFQKGYAAVAHYISEVTKMIDTIINRLGV